MEPWTAQQSNSHHHIPRWLFRSWSPGSNGVNSASIFISPAAANGKINDKFERCSSTTRRKLANAHVRWFNWSSDPLISFSSSLIFAIQHGTYKLAAPRDEFDNQHHAFLTIIDTKGIEAAFMPINKILHDSQLNEKTSAALWSGYYTHEFVAQNYLTHNGHSVSFSFQQLADAGLFRVYDEFQDESKFGELCGRWQELTASIWQETPWTMTAGEKSVMERLVKDVEPRHKYMVAVNLLSMKARGLHDQYLYAYLDELHKEDGETEDANPALVQSPEMKGAYRITNLVRALRGGSSTIALLGSLTAGDFFMTAEEGLSFLVRSSGTPFEISQPPPQEGKSREPEDSGSGAAVAATGLGLPAAEIAGDTQVRQTTSDRDLPSFAGLMTPPQSRRTSAN